MEHAWVIYGLKQRGTDEYRYVGYTTIGPSRRLLKHKKDASQRDFYVHRWIRSISTENLEIDVLEECIVGDKNYLHESEQYWIVQIKSFGHRLTNLNGGGIGGNSGWKHTEESKRKIGAKSRGNTHALGHKQTEDQKRKALQNRKKFKHTEETKNLMSYLAKSRDNTKVLSGVALYNHTRWHTNRGMSNPKCNHCSKLSDKEAI